MMEKLRLTDVDRVLNYIAICFALRQSFTAFDVASETGLKPSRVNGIIETNALHLVDEIPKGGNNNGMAVRLYQVSSEVTWHDIMHPPLSADEIRSERSLIPQRICLSPINIKAAKLRIPKNPQWFYERDKGGIGDHPADCD